MNDYIVQAVVRDAGVRVIAGVTTDLSSEGIRRHQAQGAVAQVMAEALTSAALLSATLKVQQRLAMKIQGSGKLIVESDAGGDVRGYAAPVAIDGVTANSLTSMYGADATLVVVKDLRIDELYEGVVSLVNGSWGANLTHYFDQSEQIATLVELSAANDENGALLAAGGLILQLLPDAKPEILAQLLERLEELPPITGFLVSGESPETFLEELLAGYEYKVLTKRPVQFQCSCSRARTEDALLALGPGELRLIIESEGEAVIDCNFCNERYVLTRADLEALLLRLES